MKRNDDPIERFIDRQLSGRIGWRLMMAGLVGLIGLLIFGVQALWNWLTGP